MASVRGTFKPRAAAIPVATCVTSRAWVSRVRWWSSGKMNTCVLPASRRKAGACRMRSRSRSKQVRKPSGSSGRPRCPAPAATVASGASDVRSRSSRCSRRTSRRGATRAALSTWAKRAAPTPWPTMVPAHRSLRSFMKASVRTRCHTVPGRGDRRPAARRTTVTSLDRAMTNFVDEAQLNVRGGDGGAGCVSFRREGPVTMGGPNGGDGGDGGDVWLVANRNVASLLAFRDHPHRRAGSGGHGKGKDLHGKSGSDEIVHVPEGTVVRDLYSGDVLAD